MHCTQMQPAPVSWLEVGVDVEVRVEGVALAVAEGMRGRVQSA